MWHLARRGEIARIVYVENPLTLSSWVKWRLHRADSEAASRWNRVQQQRSRIWPVSDKITVVTPLVPLPLTKSKFWNCLNRRILGFRQRHLIRRCLAGRRVDVLWVTHPYYASPEILKDFASALLWYDCTEDFSFFETYPPAVRKCIRERDRILSLCADVVSTVSQTLFAAKCKAREALLLPNAISATAFVSDASLSPPSDLREIPCPRLVFVGGVTDDLDWDLLKQVARARPDWHLVFVGPLFMSESTREGAWQVPNIHFLGEKPYDLLPAYLAQADVCLQAYRRTEINVTRNPQKFYLYLAAGKPIVSTYTADVQTFGSWVRTADTAGEFLAAVATALDEENPRGSPDRKAFARAHTWDTRGDTVLETLRDRLSSRSSSPPTVLVLPLSQDPLTGGQRYIGEFAQGLRAGGARVQGLDFREMPLLCRRAPLFLSILLSNFWILREVRRRILPGMVLLEDFFAHPRLVLTNALMSRRGAKIVAIVQSGLFTHAALRNRVPRAVDMWLVRTFFRKCVQVIANSQATRAEVLGLTGQGKVAVLEPPFEPFPRTSDPGLCEPRQPVRLLTVGRCDPIKGYEQLLQAVSRLRAYPIRLTIVGDVEDDPAYTDSLRRLTKDLGISGIVTFTGHLPRQGLVEHYSRSDIFVLPSLHEGYGLVLAEAMSFGLPVVATNVGGIPEIVENGKTGLLVPPGQIGPLSSAIETLIREPGLCQKLGRSGKLRLERFNRPDVFREKAAGLISGLAIGC